MAIIEFVKTPSEQGTGPQKPAGKITPSDADVQDILASTIKARNGAHKLGLSFEAYLLQTAVLALTEKLSPEG